MVFDPTSKGIAAVFQLLVPLAVPDPLVELLHVTAVTPTLSVEVPENTTVDPDVAKLVPAGERIVRLGGVVSTVGGGVVVNITMIVVNAVPPFLP